MMQVLRNKKVTLEISFNKPWSMKNVSSTFVQDKISELRHDGTFHHEIIETFYYRYFIMELFQQCPHPGTKFCPLGRVPARSN